MIRTTYPSMEPEFEAVGFIGDPISVVFDHEPQYSKRPHTPDRFEWRDSSYQITSLLGEWFDLDRRGRMAMNMRPENLRKAQKLGSWGVGRYFFRVEVASGRIFDIYYDRAPENASDRQGHWFIWREMRRAE